METQEGQDIVCPISSSIKGHIEGYNFIYFHIFYINDKCQNNISQVSAAQDGKQAGFFSLCASGVSTLKGRLQGKACKI